MAEKKGDQVRRERDRFIGFSFASADLLLELTGDLRICWSGGAVRALLGLESKHLSDVAVAEFLSPLDAVLLSTALRQLEPGERRRGINLTLRHATDAPRQAIACVYRSLDADKAEFFLSLSVPPASAATESKHPRDRTRGLIEAVDFAESTANALRTARAAGQSARLTLVQICGEAELDHLLGRTRSKALLAEIGHELRKHAVTEDAAAKVGDGRFSVTQLDGEPAQAITDAIVRLGENYDLDPAALKVEETAVSFRGPVSLGEDDVESILSHVLERFRTGGAEAIAAGSAESYLRKITAETLSRVVQMRDVLHERRLSLHYQPIVDLAERKPHHYEVLLRFANGKSPFEDIQFAEQINTIHEVDLAVTQGAVARLQQAAAQNQNLSLAVNMSARSLLNDNFLAMFEELSDKVGDVRDRLIIEITESAKLDDLAKAARVVDRLAARGHPICLDDFGAGASSLPYLQKLTVGYVKIDGAYVRGMPDQARERAIIQGVLATCDSLGIKTVAEMVEREEQHKKLQDLGVTLGQGWLYGHPSPDIPERVVVKVPRKLDASAIGKLLVKGN